MHDLFTGDRQNFLLRFAHCLTVLIRDRADDKIRVGIDIFQSVRIFLVDQDQTAGAQICCALRDFRCRTVGTLHERDHARKLLHIGKIACRSFSAVCICILTRLQTVGQIAERAERVHHRHEHDLFAFKQKHAALRHAGIVRGSNEHDRRTELCLVADHAGIGIIRNRLLAP